MSVRVRWVGKERLRAKLAQLAPALFAELTEGNREAAEEMVASARSLVRVRTGALQDSIRATPPGHQPPPYAQGVTATVPKGAYMVTVGNTKVRYGHLVEYGTSPHVNAGRMAGSWHPGTPPAPYFWPAYRLMRRRHRRRQSQKVGKAIRKVAKR